MFYKNTTQIRIIAQTHYKVYQTTELLNLVHTNFCTKSANKSTFCQNTTVFIGKIHAVRFLVSGKSIYAVPSCIATEVHATREN